MNGPLDMHASTLSRKARAKVYRTAARMIEQEQHHFACLAIKGSSPHSKGEFEGWCLVRDFLAMIDKRSSGSPIRGWYGVSLDQSNRDARVTALCFMAAMVETDDA